MVRFKNRYILFELEYENEKPSECSTLTITNHLKSSIEALYGDLGMGMISYSMSG